MSHKIYSILLIILVRHNNWIPRQSVSSQMARSRILSPPQRQTYNKLFTGLAWRPKMTHIQSLYLHPRILIGTKMLTRTHAHSWTHTRHCPFSADTITYEEPTIPPELNITRKKSSTIRIFCIHHQNNSIGTYEQIKLLKDIANNLQILQSHTQIAPPTPPNITVNPSKKWSKSNYPNTLPHNNIPTPQLPNYQTNLPLKFHPHFSYYIDGSFIKPK